MVHKLNELKICSCCPWIMIEILQLLQMFEIQHKIYLDIDICKLPAHFVLISSVNLTI